MCVFFQKNGPLSTLHFPLSTFFRTFVPIFMHHTTMEEKGFMQQLFGCLGKGLFWFIIVVFSLAILGAIFGSDEDKEKKSKKYDDSVMITLDDKDDYTHHRDEDKPKDNADTKRHEDKSNSKQKINTIKDPFAELERQTGMEEVKGQVATFANFIRIQKEREAKGLKSPNISYHCVFTGNPGTGKTTVARILAAIYRDLGVVSNGHLVETDRSGLIGEYVGQTAPKVNHLCDSARGGVLFIDEAYALCTGDNQDYGNEAIATLLKRMEDDRDDLVIIVAGYPDEMGTFLASNPGMQSRFNNFIHFPDFTPEELLTIFVNRANDYDYQLTDEARRYVAQHFVDKVAEGNRNFGNARYARNLFEKCITAQSNRLARKGKFTTNDLTLIEKDDIARCVE